MMHVCGNHTSVWSPVRAVFGRRAKVAVHVTHDEYTMEYMFEFLELLGIERGRVLFRNQVKTPAVWDDPRRLVGVGRIFV